MSGIRKPKKIAVFISGSGSTLQALLELHHQFDIQLVVTNKQNKLGALKAKKFGKQVFYFTKDLTFDDLTSVLKKNQIDLIFLAGFMKLLPASFVHQWRDQIFNIHPSLLPAFPGLESLEKNFHAKLNMGVTIHEVNEQMDEGRLFLQQTSAVVSQLEKVEFSQALLFARRTEQHLLREFAVRRTL